MIFNLLRSWEDYTISQWDKPSSNLDCQFPVLRDGPLGKAETWIRSKQANDGAENLWRLYDDLYDFSKFIKYHPGGPDWLTLTKGTDITEAFEVLHVTAKPRRFLHPFFVRKAQTPRNSPFTFDESNFYKTLKQRIIKKLQDVPKRPIKKSKILADVLFLGYLVTSLITIRSESYILGLISGIFLTLTCIAAHKFLHQRDNFRMYYFDFTSMSSRTWRITHVLSHHLYKNTVNDWKTPIIEPPHRHSSRKKDFLRYTLWIYSTMRCVFTHFEHYVKTIIRTITRKVPLRWVDYIPIFHLLFLYQYGGRPLTTTIFFYTFIEIISSLLLSIGDLNSCQNYQNPSNTTDRTRQLSKQDWGLYQMDSAVHKLKITSLHLPLLTCFRDRILHRLFPTVDHRRLNCVYSDFEEVRKEFNLN